MKIHAVKRLAKDLKAGSLFSTASQDYWNNTDPLAIAEKVYIRTEAPCPKDQENDEVYEITVYEGNISHCGIPVVRNNYHRALAKGASWYCRVCDSHLNKNLQKITL